MTNLHYSDLNLKKHNFKLHALKRIFLFGLSSLVRNLCDTFMNFLLLFIFSSILIKIIGDGALQLMDIQISMAQYYQLKHYFYH